MFLMSDVKGFEARGTSISNGRIAFTEFWCYPYKVDWNTGARIHTLNKP